MCWGTIRFNKMIIFAVFSRSTVFIAWAIQLAFKECNEITGTNA
jgi:hypothetical protein